MSFFSDLFWSVSVHHPVSPLQGLAYLGEYPLAWAACLCNETVYNLLVEEGADPDSQDTYGNTVLLMVVIKEQLGMFGYAVKHPIKKANHLVR